MKILIDARIAEVATSGVVTYIDQLIKQYVKYHPSINVILMQGPSNNIQCIKEVQTITTQYITDSIEENKEIKKIINSVNPDLYHATWFIPPEDLKCKVLFTVYDNLFAMNFMIPNSEPCQPRHNRLKTAVKRVDYFIAISERTRKDFIETYGVLEDNIFTIYLAGLSNNEENEFNYSFKKNICTPLIFSSGNFAYYKNQQGLIKAIYCYNKKNSNTPLKCLVSGGNKMPEKEIQDLIDSLNMNQFYTRLGFLSRKKYLEYLCKSKMLVIPSLYEGFGIPLLEAAKCKIPIACSDIDVFHEVIGENALFFDPKNPADIADKIEIIMNDSKEVNKIIESAFNWQEAFSWKQTADKTISIYNKIIGF